MSKKEKTAAEQNEAQQETAAAEEVKTEQQPEEKTELEKLQQDYAALNDKYLRLIAEYDNFRKRSQRERDAIYPDATVAAAGVFLPVADNFERAIAAECADAEYKKGTELVFQSLKDCFAKLWCSGGCAANSYHATGSVKGVYSYGCDLFKKRLECAIMMKVAELDEK